VTEAIQRVMAEVERSSGPKMQMPRGITRRRETNGKRRMVVAPDRTSQGLLVTSTWRKIG
jgi:hypothetical protein